MEAKADQDGRSELGATEGMVPMTFPTTDDVCSRVALGTGRLHQRDLANMEATIRRAYDLGIRHFDSSVGYDNAAPHAALSRLIRDVPADDIFISTKIGHISPSFPDYRSLYRNRDALLGVVHECHRMLLGKIDLLQIHEADLRFWWDDGAPNDRHCFILPGREYDFRGAPVYDVVRYAKSNGVCRYVGITGNSSVPLSRVAAALRVDTVMCAYNMDPVFRGTVDTVAPIARRRGQFLMAAGVLQRGHFRDPDRLPDPMAKFDHVRSAFSRFGAIQRSVGLPAIELVSRWAFSIVAADKIVVGASNPDQLEELIGFFRKGPLPDDVLSALDGLALPGFDWCELWT
jgi:D-threo-aldose 1-dehydrogenase